MKPQNTIYEHFKMNIDDRSVREDARISDVVEKMRVTGQNCLLVRDREGHGAGVISEHDIVRAFDLGVDDYVTKPFSPLEVISRVKRLMRR